LCYTSAVADQETPHPDQVFEALELAAHAAEGRVRTGGPCVVPPALFREVASRSPAHVKGLVERVLMGPEPEAGLDVLLGTGALVGILPEVHALVGFGDGEWRHKDVWKHTKQVVRQAVPRVEVRWAALLHDIGKIKTRTISPDGEVHFFGHAEVGARMFDKMERRLGLFRAEPALQTTVRFLILHHLRANQYEASWTDSAVRRFAREMGAELENLLCLAQADITTKRPEKKRRGLRQIEELTLRIRELAALDAVQPPLPSGVGNLIMEAFGIPPSRLIGDIKRALEAAVESGEIPGHERGEFYVEFLRANRSRFGLPEGE
jgi:poly(A) polymerase